jgi:tRNA pseudouridine13 synthase
MDWRAAILEPPLQTASLPGVGGLLRSRLEDFRVEEIPAYAPAGATAEGSDEHAHLFLTLTKRGRSTHDAISILSKHLGIDTREIGSAGRKDRDAVTTQWISVPASVGPHLSGFRHDEIELGPATGHPHKLRMGHSKGNRFTIVIRSTSVPPCEAISRIEAKLRALEDDGGLLNLYGPQRFGLEGRSLDRGIEALARGRAGKRGNMTVAAGQAGLFNAWVAVRRHHGALHRVLLGDVLEKTSTGGLFVCDDPGRDQVRLEAGELVITGPVFGSRMRTASEGSPAAALEHETLEIVGIPTTALSALGRRAAGTRRSMRIHPTRVRIEAFEDAGVRVGFDLPAGSYATQVCRELQGAHDGRHPERGRLQRSGEVPSSIEPGV